MKTIIKKISLHVNTKKFLVMPLLNTQIIVFFRNI